MPSNQPQVVPVLCRPMGQNWCIPKSPSRKGKQRETIFDWLNLATNDQTDLSTPEQGFDDTFAVWRPDGEMLAITRRDETFARGEQVYLVDPVTGNSEQLTDDPRYLNGYVRWDPAGTQLLFQRFPLLDENMRPDNNGRPEIWTLDLTTGALTQVAINGFIPRWVP